MKRVKINGIESAYYFVDMEGNIYNKEGKRMKYIITSDGYYRVGLKRDLPNKLYRVNRIVAETYLDNFDALPIVHHINGNRLDNRVENLMWCNYEHNNSERYREYKGTKCKKVYQLDMSNNIIAVWDSPIYAEQALGICRQNISKVCRGERKTAGGFKWSYSCPCVETIEH